MDVLLAQLESAGLIALQLGKDPVDIYSYRLVLPAQEIILLNILEDTGENLDCNNKPSEDFYRSFRCD